MANVIKLRRGLDINLKGAAAQELVSVKEPGFYSLVPDDYTGCLLYTSPSPRDA